MEIPVLNRISDLEALHQSPSNFLISQSSLSISGIARFSHAYTFWKWGAFLLLALLASFSALLNFFRRLRPLPPQPLFHYQSDADTDDDVDDRETDDDSDSESETEAEEDFDFRVRGSGKLRLRHRRSIGDIFSWADLAPGKSVVKLWDNLGLGLDFLDDGNVFSLRDGNKEQEINYFLDAPAVAVAAGESGSGNVEVKLWDRRVSCRIPAMIAEWHSQSKKMVSFNASGFEKLFVDMRKPNAPLRSVTDSEVEAWWDADGDDDAVTATDEDLSLARCCDAVRSHFLLGRDPNL